MTVDIEMENAYNKNIKVVYIPKQNYDDLKDIPKIVFDNMEIKTVDNFDEMYDLFFK